jgi:hypothetical protein
MTMTQDHVSRADCTCQIGDPDKQKVPDWFRGPGYYRTPYGIHFVSLAPHHKQVDICVWFKLSLDRAYGESGCGNYFIPYHSERHTWAMEPLCALVGR